MGEVSLSCSGLAAAQRYEARVVVLDHPPPARVVTGLHHLKENATP